MAQQDLVAWVVCENGIQITMLSTEDKIKNILMIQEILKMNSLLELIKQTGGEKE